jgi:hypothetical protein
MLGKQLDYLIPLRCTPSDPMNQYHRWPMPGDVEIHTVPMQRNLNPFDHRDRLDTPLTAFNRRLRGPTF